MKSEAAFAAENARLRKKRIGSIGAGARSSQRTNASVSIEPIASAADDLGARPADRVPADDAPDDAEEPGARQREAGKVEPVDGP